MIIRKIFVLVVLLMIISGCEYTYDYTYTVTNKSDGNIKVSVKTFHIDSTYTIPVDSTKILFTTDHGIEGSTGPYFSNVTDDLDSFMVKKNDTINSTRNYLVNEAWVFNDGDYSTTVTNEEFK